MNFSLRQSTASAFTLVELMVAGALFTVVGFVGYLLSNTGAVLFSKNYSINASGSEVRRGLDRINSEVSQATNLPELITLGGNGTFSTTVTGPAAGIIFDKYLGGPYVLQSNGAATETKFFVKRSTVSLVVAPTPRTDDVLQIDGSKVRSRINTAKDGTESNNLIPCEVTLKSGSTAGIGWLATDYKQASLVRKMAFIVVGNELRYYPFMEGVTNYTTAPFTVITNTVGTGTGEGTPFKIEDKNGRSFLAVSFRVQTRDTNLVLAKKERKEVNTSMSMSALIRPRNATY